MLPAQTAADVFPLEQLLREALTAAEVSDEESLSTDDMLAILKASGYDVDKSGNARRSFFFSFLSLLFSTVAVLFACLLISFLCIHRFLAISRKCNMCLTVRHLPENRGRRRTSRSSSLSVHIRR